MLGTSKPVISSSDLGFSRHHAPINCTDFKVKETLIKNYYKLANMPSLDGITW